MRAFLSSSPLVKPKSCTLHSTGESPQLHILTLRAGVPRDIWGIPAASQDEWVQGVGFRVQGSGFRVWGFGFGVWS